MDDERGNSTEKIEVLEAGRKGSDLNEVRGVKPKQRSFSCIALRKF